MGCRPAAIFAAGEGGIMEQGKGLTPRTASLSDAPTIAALLDTFNREFEVPTPGVEALTARLERVLGGSAMLVMLIGDPAVGFALLTFRPAVWFDGPVAVLDELYVAPERRGHGLGSALLDAAEHAVRARGGALVEVNVDGDDVDAQRFYRRHGYANSEPGESEPLLYYYRELTREPPPSPRS
jgi:ribosomal protein S18 acetylase RimI-like enzyme